MKEVLVILVLFVYLLACSYMDYFTYYVYDFYHMIPMLVGAVLCCTTSILPSGGISLIVFVLIQYFIFSKMYGKADVAVFVICALYYTYYGYYLKNYLIHMLLAVLSMGIVQGIKKNISKKGNLKKSIPFVPYISISFFGYLLFLRFFF